MELQVGVKAILKRPDNTFLVLRRSEECGDIAGTWDIPGGRIKPGESHLDGLEREVLEETGLDMSQIKTKEPHIVASQDILRPDKHVVRLSFIVEVKGGDYEIDFSGDGENNDYKWIDFGKSGIFEGLDPFVAEILSDL